MASRLWKKLVALEGFSAKSAKSAALNPEKPRLAMKRHPVVMVCNASSQVKSHLQISVLKLWHFDRHKAWRRVRSGVSGIRHLSRL
jgi:hypothetical protein